MTTMENQRLMQQDGSLSEDSDSRSMEEDSTASILASVREQEHEFAKLTKEIEDERRTVAQQLNNDRDYSVRSESMNSEGYYDSQQGDYVTETFSRREDYSDPRVETEVMVDDDGVAKTVTKRIVTKTVTERRVRHIEDEGSLPRNNHSLSRPVRTASDRSNPELENGYNSNRRPKQSNMSSPSYQDERTGLLARRSSGSSSGSSGGMRQQPQGYRYNPPRQDNFGSTDEVRKQTPEKFQPEDYGLEDDKGSDYDDDGDQYGLEPSSFRENTRRPGSVSSDGSSSNRYESDMPTAAPRIANKSQIGRAPLATQEAGSRGSLDRLGNWKTPTLPEIIKMLSIPVPVVQQNAAAYLQHLCYNDDETKSDIRQLGGIPLLIKCLDNSSPAVEFNAAGTLRNLCYGPKNDKNKIEIKKCEGVPAVVRLIRAARNVDTKEQATGTLWNLSAHPDLKGQVLELGLEPLTNLVIAPYAETVSKDNKPKDVVMQDVFTNAVGVIRNLSSTDSVENRKRLRQCPDLVYSLMCVLQANVENGNIQNKATENIMCVLRNLTYKIQDETVDYDTLHMPAKPDNTEDKTDTSCFGKNKQKEKTPEVVEQIPPNDPDAVGADLLYQPENARLYISVLQDCQKGDITEACLGTLQNLTNGVWKWAGYARAVVRKEKGLPVIIDRLRTDNDQIVRAGTIALTNLSEDHKNKELIGKFAMKDLIYKLPGVDPNVRISDTTTIAVLNTIRSLVQKSPENTRHLRDAAGIEKITTINNPRDNSRYHARVVKAAGQVLVVIWENKEVRSQLKKDGWKKNHFTPSVTINTLPRNSGKASSTPYEDPRSTPGGSVGGRRSQRNETQSTEEIPLQTPKVELNNPNARKENADSWV